MFGPALYKRRSGFLSTLSSRAADDQMLDGRSVRERPISDPPV
jgi:hypothetical protein